MTKKLVFFLLLVLGISCQGSRTVYICGGSISTEGQRIPCYWKNGVRTDLVLSRSTWNGYATDIQVYNGDIYVGGFSENVGKPEAFGQEKKVPCYWKNGVQQELSVLEVSRDSYAGEVNEIFCDETGFYLVGYVSSDYLQVPCLWKDGQRTDLPVLSPFESGSAVSIWVYKGDVFVAGYAKNFMEDSIPCFWKNGKVFELAKDNYLAGDARSIYVDDTAVYICGGARNTEEGLYKACFWKDGVISILDVGADNRFARAVAISVAKGTVYLAGTYLKATDTPAPLMWKNNKMADLSVPDATKQGYSEAIFIWKNMVYIAGTIYNQDDVAVPCYWVDSQRTELSRVDITKEGYAYAVFVK